MSQIKEKFTTLSQLEQSGEYGEVWCLNSTTAAERAQITFSVGKLSGDGADAVYVPVTFVPIQLTAQVTKKQLLNSGNFRRAVSMGCIRLITDDHANVMLQGDGVQAELQRLRSESANSDFAQVALASGIHVESSGGNMSAMATPTDGEAVEPEVNPAITVVLAQLSDSEITEVDALNRLRGLGDLQLFEYKHISKNTKGYPMFVRWIKSIRNRLESGVEEPVLADSDE
jgi:hypothetical protein